jgi:hypothetical protein
MSRSARERRQALLERLVGELAEHWLTRVIDEFGGGGRHVEGAWPATLGEARARIDAYLLPALVREQARAPSEAERVELARALYFSAARRWMERCKLDRKLRARASPQTDPV